MVECIKKQYQILNLGEKGLPGTNTLAYFLDRHCQRKKKFYLTNIWYPHPPHTYLVIDAHCKKIILTLISQLYIKIIKFLP